MLYDQSASKLKCYNTTLSEEDCLAATQLLEDEGCCTPSPVYNMCNICGNATFYPESIVFRLGTCDYVQLVMNAEDCAPVENTKAPAGPAPDESTGEHDPAPFSPPSASSAVWSTGSMIIAMICPATSTLSVSEWLLELN